MEIEIQIADSDAIQLHLDLTQSIGDIKHRLIEQSLISGDSSPQRHLFYDSSSGLLFGDNVSIKECITTLRPTETDKLCLHLARMFVPNRAHIARNKRTKAMPMKLPKWKSMEMSTNPLTISKRARSRHCILRSSNIDRKSSISS